jgi:hypothetical protein
VFLLGHHRPVYVQIALGSISSNTSTSLSVDSLGLFQQIFQKKGIHQFGFTQSFFTYFNANV